MFDKKPALVCCPRYLSEKERSMERDRLLTAPCMVLQSWYLGGYLS